MLHELEQNQQTRSVFARKKEKVQDSHAFCTIFAVKLKQNGVFDQDNIIVEFEQGGNAKAKYGDKLLINLSKDLTRLKGKGFSRSNLTYMRKLYLVFPKCETLSHQLTWSHYFELLKCEDKLEMQL